mgnify:CR=1 FL=1
MIEIERLAFLEERLGVRLEGLSAFSTEDNLFFYVEICGEMQSANGTKLQQNISIVFDVYDTSGRIVQTDSTFSPANAFFEFMTFSKRLSIPVPNISKIRIYPKL